MIIVGQSFTPLEFAAYVKQEMPTVRGWKPQFCVLHNTAPPTLAQRPNGFSLQNMGDMKVFYEDKGWHAGPHLFVDDKKIWAFSPLSKPGVHSPSWNDASFGIEQLGDYDTDAYQSGRGYAVQKNAIAAIACLSHWGCFDSSSLRLHKEDPLTTHKDCPGANCANHKAAIITGVHEYILANLI